MGHWTWQAEGGGKAEGVSCGNPYALCSSVKGTLRVTVRGAGKPELHTHRKCELHLVRMGHHSG